jgi:hypothetical protein
MSFKCKCSNRYCRKRRTLPKHPDAYKRPPKCEGCGGNRWAVDLHRQLKKPGYRPPMCWCDGRPFPHRNDDRNCMHHENYKLDAAMRNTKARFKNNDADCPF